MSALSPPTDRAWWKQPLDRVEGTWIAIAFVWCMVMFFMMGILWVWWAGRVWLVYIISLARRSAA